MTILMITHDNYNTNYNNNNTSLKNRMFQDCKRSLLQEPIFPKTNR